MACVRFFPIFMNKKIIFYFYFSFFERIFRVSGYKGYQLKGFYNPTWPPICVYFNSILFPYTWFIRVVIWFRTTRFSFSSFVVAFFFLETVSFLMKANKNDYWKLDEKATRKYNTTERKKTVKRNKTRRKTRTHIVQIRVFFLFYCNINVSASWMHNSSVWTYTIQPFGQPVACDQKHNTVNMWLCFHFLFSYSIFYGFALTLVSIVITQSKSLKRINPHAYAITFLYRFSVCLLLFVLSSYIREFLEWNCTVEPKCVCPILFSLSSFNCDIQVWLRKTHITQSA